MNGLYRYSGRPFPLSEPALARTASLP